MPVAPLSLTTPSSGPSPTQLCLVSSSLPLAPRDPDLQGLPGPWKSSQSSQPAWALGSPGHSSGRGDVLLQYPHCSGVRRLSQGDAAGELVWGGVLPFTDGADARTQPILRRTRVRVEGAPAQAWESVPRQQLCHHPAGNWWASIGL
uniref:Macaca fascicularis brain cDNA clone: QtrA-18473, similar to human chromosome 7 open reading frame 32 (C7orf32), mRNA, RefSeq: XM_379968.1 n=1 Tax=Macaca fascicularis TaxID=9541 RepID=I7GF41_MACFA|nr:unnamed protein product [Macaca fascicularis]